MISIKLRPIVIFAIYFVLHFFYLFVVAPIRNVYKCVQAPICNFLMTDIIIITCSDDCLSNTVSLSNLRNARVNVKVIKN